MSDNSISRRLPEAFNLTGRRVVVTGAASGIGRATAGALAQLGADLILVDRSSLSEVCADNALREVSPRIIRADLLASGVISDLFASDRIHAVVHCAGIIPRTPWLEDPEWPERFAQTLGVNVRLPIEIGHAAIEHMTAYGGGRIVFTGSVAGWSGGTLLTTPPDYVASKGALHAIVRMLAKRGVTRGVLVNAVAPGPVATPFGRETIYPPGTFPLGRIAEPEEVAWPIAFLCADASSYFSGEIININGGTLMN